MRQRDEIRIITQSIGRSKPSTIKYRQDLAASTHHHHHHHHHYYYYYYYYYYYRYYY